jgi:hypothetical protein
MEPPGGGHGVGPSKLPGCGHGVGPSKLPGGGHGTGPSKLPGDGGQGTGVSKLGTAPVPACNAILVRVSCGTSATKAPAIKRTISAAKSRLQIREFFIRSSPRGVISGRVEKFLSRRESHNVASK